MDLVVDSFGVANHVTPENRERLQDVLKGVHLIEKKGLEYFRKGGGVYSVGVSELLQTNTLEKHHWSKCLGGETSILDGFHKTFCESYQAPLLVCLWDGVRAEVVYSHSMIWVFIDAHVVPPYNGFYSLNVLGDEVIKCAERYMRFENDHGWNLEPTGYPVTRGLEGIYANRRTADLATYRSKESLNGRTERYVEYRGLAYSVVRPYCCVNYTYKSVSLFKSRIQSWWYYTYQLL